MTTISLVRLHFLSARSVRISSLGLSSTRRMVRFSIIVPSLSQSEIECGAFSHICLSPDKSTVAADNPFDRCQADADALKLGEFVQAVEGKEELVGIVHVKARPVVPDEIYGFPLLFFAAELEAGSCGPVGVLPGIVDKVLHDDLNQA